jgi:hypothetical protein
MKRTADWPWKRSRSWTGVWTSWRRYRRIVPSATWHPARWENIHIIYFLFENTRASSCWRRWPAPEGLLWVSSSFGQCLCHLLPSDLRETRTILGVFPTHPSSQLESTSPAKFDFDWPCVRVLREPIFSFFSVIVIRVVFDQRPIILVFVCFAALFFSLAPFSSSNVLFF